MPRPKTAPVKQRVPLWDNARFVAITLVVIGHAILKLIADSDTSYTVYLFVYAFHVPVFVAVSGYFAKSSAPGPKQLRRIITDLVIPYLIFETAWTLIHWLVDGKLSLDYALPSWTLWFILSLIAWRVMLPYLVLLRYPLLISVIVSVAAGYVPEVTNEFSVSRTLGLLPFFVLGWQLRTGRLTARWLRLRAAAIAWWRVGAIVVFASLAIVLTVGIDYWRDISLRRFQLFDESYSSIGYHQWWAGGIRLAVIACGALLIFAFLALIPRRRTFFSDLGQATLYIYLLHTFVLYPFRDSGVLNGPQPWWVLPGMILFAVLVSFALASRPIRRIFRPVIEPNPRWLFRREALLAEARHARDTGGR
jgi:fucose 4-O-acetylase-like acetyltransferase